MYDAIVIGGRFAGAVTAMTHDHRGHRVFPFGPRGMPQ